MKKEFMVERQGKQFCLYAGLIDLAHERGLVSIETCIVQIPDESNKQTAICTALVKLKDGDTEKTFSGIADASPINVGPSMRTCVLRMAETRAKSRALRDAVNVAVAALEELGEESPQEQTPMPQAAPQPNTEEVGKKFQDMARAYDYEGNMGALCREILRFVPDAKLTRTNYLSALEKPDTDWIRAVETLQAQAAVRAAREESSAPTDPKALEAMTR